MVPLQLYNTMLKVYHKIMLLHLFLIHGKQFKHANFTKKHNKADLMTKCWINKVDDEIDNHILVTKGINVDVKKSAKNMTTRDNKSTNDSIFQRRTIQNKIKNKMKSATDQIKSPLEAYKSWLLWEAVGWWSG